MARAIVPAAIPSLPLGTSGWARSTKGHGGMYHAHSLGRTACGTLYLERHEAEEALGLGDFQFWGVCPRCYRKGNT